MREEFIKLRLDMAVQMLEGIHSDLINDEELNVSEETASELGNIIVQMKNITLKKQKGE